MFERKLEKYNQLLAELKKEAPGDELSFESPRFGNYILLKKSVGNAHAELEWCGWVIGILDRQEEITML